jgi:hypothetical protein
VFFRRRVEARQGFSGARRGLRHEGAVQEGEEGKGARELLEKRRGTSASLPGEGPAGI